MHDSTSCETRCREAMSAFSHVMALIAARAHAERWRLIYEIIRYQTKRVV